MQKMLKIGNKHMTVICDTCLKFSRDAKTSSYFHFEQLLIIPLVLMLANVLNTLLVFYYVFKCLYYTNLI